MSNSKWNPHFISANITEERYPLYDDACVFRNNQYALIPVRYCIVMYSCPSKCMSSLVLSTDHLLAFDAVLMSIAGEVDFVCLDCRVECDCCRLQAMRLMHSYLPK